MQGFSLREHGDSGTSRQHRKGGRPGEMGAGQGGAGWSGSGSEWGGVGRSGVKRDGRVVKRGGCGVLSGCYLACG